MIKRISHKKQILFITGTAVFILGMICAVNAQETPAEQKDDFWSQYGIIVERNIFSRNRGPKPQRSDGSDSENREVYVPQPESYYVLKGVAKEMNVFVAFFEDLRNGSIIRVKSQDKIARGEVINMTLDSVTYKLNDSEVSITVGKTLEDKVGGAALTYDNLMEWSSGTAQSQTQPTESTETVSDDDADILRKLMERRQQQVGD